MTATFQPTTVAAPAGQQDQTPAPSGYSELLYNADLAPSTEREWGCTACSACHSRVTCTDAPETAPDLQKCC